MKRTIETKIIPSLFLLLVLLAISQVPGCGGGGDGGGGGSATTGTLQVSITDAPPTAPVFASVHLTVDKVVVVPVGREGAPDNDASLPVIATFPSGVGVDILNLHFLPQLLGSATIPAGSYSQVRLILAANPPTALTNYVTFANAPSQRVALTTPSAQQSGVKIIGNFTVTAGVLNTILLDFNPTTAIVVAGNSGNVNLKPTGIRIIQVFDSLANAGSVSGTIRSPAFGAWSSATVSVVPRNPAGSAVTSGIIFSNFSSPSVWKAPFTAILPPTGGGTMPSANYRVLVQAYRATNSQGPVFGLYSSPLFTVSTGVDTAVPPAGVVQLAP
ncbi:DUF4382 domain-containing protein [Geomonas sp. RF6]|uniref:DUF4382 domain-containing protein n=1 Tax=Geomonas sp. RF6 TaxID=2897342 RepID=UPI001E325046|nr:DUF4382 domain-containing protein [Geomonas sp. RF6]UFS71664.1 DUF4382 domain-containing protein [Geomonas sp. RF6]